MAREKNLSHQPLATANALAATGAVFYLGCALLVSVSRPTYTLMMRGWFHGINYQALPPAPMMGQGVLTGLLTFTLVAWLAGYLFANFYNWFTQR